MCACLTLRQADLASVFSKIQSDDDAAMAAETAAEEGGGGGGGDVDESAELSYPEFLEGLCAIAVYKDPDPYKPLEKRVEDFLTGSILAGSKGRKKKKK